MRPEMLTPAVLIALIGLIACPAVSTTWDWSGDLDTDGDFEVVTVSWDDATVSVLDAGGRLLIEEPIAIGRAMPRFADADEDGLPDLLFDDRIVLPGSRLSRALRHEYGGFSETWNTADALRNVWDSEVDDLDGDGAREIIGQAYYYPGTLVRVFENSGNDSFTEVWASPEQSTPSIVAIGTGETDGDGAREIYAGVAGTLGDLFLWENTGDDTYTEHPFPFQTGYQVRDLHTGNLDGDDHMEIVAVGGTSDGGTLLLIEHSGLPGENAYTSSYYYGTVSYLLGCEIGDADNDGNMEALLNVGGWAGFPTYIRRIEYNPDSNWYEHKTFEATTTGLPISAVIADLDGDDVNELAIGSIEVIYIYESYADDTFTPVWTSDFPIAGNVMAMTVGPDNAFGYPTIATCSFDGQVDIFGYDGSDYVRHLGTPLSLPDPLRSIDLGLFDGDELQDLVLARSGSDLVSCLEEAYVFAVDEEEGETVSDPQLALSSNPFQPGGTIGLRVPVAQQDATLEILDTRGRLVRRFGRIGIGSGVQSLTWDGRDAAGRRVASGVYLLRLQAEDRGMTRRLVLLR